MQTTTQPVVIVILGKIELCIALDKLQANNIRGGERSCECRRAGSAFIPSHRRDVYPCRSEYAPFHWNVCLNVNPSGSSCSTATCQNWQALYARPVFPHFGPNLFRSYQRGPSAFLIRLPDESPWLTWALHRTQKHICSWFLLWKWNERV